MSVGTYALTTLAEATAFIGGVASRDALWLYCSQADATAATAEVTDLALVLIITGGAQAGTNTLTFADATKNTLTELVAVINALTGWKAGLLYHGSADSTDLLPTGALSCLSSANEITLKIADNYLLERLIDRASDFIERWCERKLKSRVYDRQVYEAVRGNKLILEQYPVTRLGRLSIGRVNCISITNTMATNFAAVEVTSTLVRLTADGTVTTKTISDSATINDLITAINTAPDWTATLLVSDYGARKAYYTSLDGTAKVPEILPMTAHDCISPNLAYIEIPQEDLAGHYLLTNYGDEDRNPGIIYSPSGWAYGHQSIFVDMTAGYTTIPFALEMLCLEMVKDKYDQSKKDLSVKSETLGDYSYTLADWKVISDSVKEAAGFFRRRII